MYTLEIIYDNGHIYRQTKPTMTDCTELARQVFCQDLLSGRIAISAKVTDAKGQVTPIPIHDAGSILRPWG